jgi:hypothetical protein
MRSLRLMSIAGCPVLLLLGLTQDAFAQNTIRVPEDFPTIQLAVNNAVAGDSIRVGPGDWCGARITKTLNLTGEGATIIGCPPGNPGPVGNLARIGFVVNFIASGTTIGHFVFDGRGYSGINTVPLGEGVSSQFGTANVVIEHNRFLGGVFGVIANGNGWNVSHNVFDGFSMLGDDSFFPGLGGVAIVSENFGPDSGFPPFTGNVYMFNQITATVPEGDFAFASWINEVNVPFAGILIAGHDGTVLSNNKVSITSNSAGDAGAGIIATDATVDGPSSTTMNLVITNNDARRSAYGLIIPRDQSNGTGNTAGATIRGNFGVNRINGDTTNVRNRSIFTLLECDATGACP